MIESFTPQALILTEKAKEKAKSLKDGDKLLNNFIWTTAKQDSYRNEHFPDTFPEYKEWWEEITAGKTINLIEFNEIN